MIFLFNLGDVQVPAVDFQTCIRLVPVIIHGFAMFCLCGQTDEHISHGKESTNPSSNLHGAGLLPRRYTYTWLSQEVSKRLVDGLQP